MTAHQANGALVDLPLPMMIATLAHTAQENLSRLLSLVRAVALWTQ